MILAEQKHENGLPTSKKGQNTPKTETKWAERE